MGSLDHDLPFLFLVHSLGNSGGSWLESALNTHPEVEAREEFCWELSALDDQTLKQGVSDLACIGFHVSMIDKAKSVGFIKSYGPETREWGNRIGATYVALLRDRIRQLHGVRRRVHQAVYVLGRQPKNELEQFRAQAEFQSSRYRHVLQGREPWWRLEDIRDAVRENDPVVIEWFSWLTGIDWEWDMEAIQNTSPRHRKAAKTVEQRFAPHYEDGHGLDPRAETIWHEIWSQEQRGIFRCQYGDIYERLGYTWP